MKPTWLASVEVAEMKELMRVMQSELKTIEELQAALSPTETPPSPPQPSRQHLPMLQSSSIPYKSHVSGRSVQAVRPVKAVAAVDVIPGKAAQELRKLTHSAYLSRRSSVGVSARPLALASPLQSHDAHAESNLMREVESLPGFSGTVLVDAAALEDASSVSRKHGMERFDGFLRELELVTGMDFSLLRDDMPSATAHADEIRLVTTPIRDVMIAGRAPTPPTPRVLPLLPSISPPMHGFDVSPLLVRQLKEAVKAKAGAALLDAARVGSSFMIPKLLDTGVPIPTLLLRSKSIEEIMEQDIATFTSSKPSSGCEFVQASVDVTDDGGQTPLMVAAYHGYATFVQKLLERGASLRKHNWAGDTAFQCACRGLDAAKQACTRGIVGGRAWAAGCSLIKRALDDRTLVQCAAERDFKRVRYLVESGHDPREANAHGMTALHFAVMKESPQIVKYLMRRGADPNAMNSVGQSPVSIATDMDAVGLLWALDPENYRDDR